MVKEDVKGKCCFIRDGWEITVYSNVELLSTCLNYDVSDVLLWVVLARHPSVFQYFSLCFFCILVYLMLK